MASTATDFRSLKLNGHVGFDSLPDQMVAKALFQGFTFNILCVGETGLGKSTLMETLFNQHFEFTPSTHSMQNIELKAKTYDLKENNVKLNLTLVETAGYSDQINKDENVNAIVEYIDSQFESYLQEEMKIKRNLESFHDSRIHACLYFIAPTGHSLKSIDVVTMKKLHQKVNLIPVIAKSDTITKSELESFKAKINQEILENQIQIYRCPTDDEQVKSTNEAMNGIIPFAVVGCTDESKVNGKSVRARQYPWGIVQVDNPAHCDFVKLREMLLRANLEDLRETTHTQNYERYRQHRLTQMGFRDDEVSIQEVYVKRREMQREQQQKKEEEMRLLFVTRVREKEEELKEAEKRLNSQFEQVKKQHADERKRYEEKKRQLEDEMNAMDKRRQVVEPPGKSGLTLKRKK